MSTRSLIGILKKDGKDKYVDYIYCRWDGYIEYVGKILNDNYNNKDLIYKLLNLGDLSVLGTEPISNPNYWKDPSKNYNENYYENYCLAYKDRGETNTDYKTCKLNEYNKCGKDSWAEYIYLFKNDKWYYKSRGIRTYKDLDLEIKKYNI